jgi:signal transduction histidine kinase
VRSAIRWIPWLNLGVCLALTALTLVFVTRAWTAPNFSRSDDFTYSLTFWPVPLLVFPAVGALIAAKQPRNAVGWLFCAIGLLFTTSFAAGAYATDALGAHPGHWPGADLANWFTSWEFFPCLGLIVIYVPLLFPSGRPPGGRWRLLLPAGAVGIVLVSINFALAPGKLDDFLGGRPNPYGVLPAWLATTTLIAGLPMVIGGAVGAAAAMVVRLRRARGLEREQLEWIAFAAAIMAIAFAAHVVMQLSGLAERYPWYWLPWGLALCGIPAAAGIAMLKHGLFDVELIISRTTAYAVLTAAVAGSYAGLVTVIGRVVGDSGWLPSLAATGVLVVGFQPARDRVQRGVDRLLFGDRGDPYAVVAHLGRRIEMTPGPDDVLPAIVSTLVEALKLPYAAIFLNREDGPALVAAAGSPAAAGLQLPLVHQAQAIGELIVAPRTPGEAFGPADRRLLEDLARQVGAAAHGVRLTAEIQRSRERIVTAREEERRRLRRDLHDGLGSQLAALAIQSSALRPLVKREPDEVERELADVSDELRSAVADIRRLAHGLRPPALDELGLVGALRERALRLSRGARSGDDGVAIAMRLPDELLLPAAVEVAIYRITEEALTNIVKHARASQVDIELVVGKLTELTISDDGVGLPDDARPGVGLLSMRERAEELGGTLTIARRDCGSGTRLHVVLPGQAGEP